VGTATVQQKLFRIEQMVGERRAQVPARAAPTHAHHAGSGEPAALKRELALLRDVLARNARELSMVLTEGKERRMIRAAGELGAAVDAMEKATDKILRSAEIIDDRAKALAFAQRTDYERSLARDIQEHVVHVYEACNFQDLSGQRIGKVIATLGLVEDCLTEVIEHSKSAGGAGQPAAPAPARELLNGPKLDGDSGHASQHEIDALFG
jgi:chemotaxis protein CheZ